MLESLRVCTKLGSFRYLAMHSRARTPEFKSIAQTGRLCSTRHSLMLRLVPYLAHVGDGWMETERWKLKLIRALLGLFQCSVSSVDSSS